MKYYFNGRQVEVVEVEYDDSSIMILGARYSDLEEELNEEECIMLENKYQSQLVEDYLSSAIDQAEYYMDVER